MSQLVWVTGKGGVGKSWVAKRLHDRYEGSCRLQLTDISRSELAEDFLLQTFKIKWIAEWLSHSSVFQNLLRLAPNLHELLLLHRLLEMSKSQTVIVDAPATGHLIAIFEALRTAQEIFDGGSLKRLSEEILLELCRAGRVCVQIVSLSEASSLSESRQLDDYFATHFSAFARRHILNRRHAAPPADCPDPWKTEGQKRFEREHDRQIKSKLPFQEIFEETPP